MPALLGVSLVPEKEIPSSELTPDRIHALFFSLLRSDLAKELHRPSRIKPFCLWFSPFFGPEKKLSKFRMEISFLKEDLFPKFLSSFLLEDSPLKLGEIGLKKIKRPHISEENILSYRKIYENAPEEKTIVMDFLTPTCFKKGSADYPLPDPFLVFKSLIRKWSAFSEIKVEVDLREVFEKKIRVAGAWIRTRKVELSRLGKILGFTGRVVFYVESEEGEVLKWVNALAKFGEFAGVGRKTTMGFGKVRIQKPVSSENLPVEPEEVKEERVTE